LTLNESLHESVGNMDKDIMLGLRNLARMGLDSKDMANLLSSSFSEKGLAVLSEAVDKANFQKKALSLTRRFEDFHPRLKIVPDLKEYIAYKNKTIPSEESHYYLSEVSDPRGMSITQGIYYYLHGPQKYSFLLKESMSDIRKYLNTTGSTAGEFVLNFENEEKTIFIKRVLKETPGLIARRLKSHTG